CSPPSPILLLVTMAHQTENNVVGWTPVPQFGAWDQKNAGATDYSMIFNQARANRKQHKSDVRRSLGNDRDLVVSSFPKRPPDDHYPVSKKKKILTYINCCIKP
ncbi:hypothetical protein E1A91_A09G119800v1, partial [Gossypium mustelinum]